MMCCFRVASFKNGCAADLLFFPPFFRPVETDVEAETFDRFVKCVVVIQFIEQPKMS